ncbi:hypothetical protein EC973_001138 [Apophysomyces ossiformis]|uniref:Rho-GAP domain-containing protein n=1 Tax=Apophysomyces ossiformis TaxID=679940 RepID=A0A8H7BPS8_9FUNG|nr:hypothetical protein EC973_001138 [Apophysomyces ossiformis]
MSSFDIPGVLSPRHKALIRSWWKRVTMANPRVNNFKEMKIAVAEKGVFGIPLTESVQYAYSSISYVDDLTGTEQFGVIPTIIAKCGSFLKEEDRSNPGLATLGLFRLCGNCKRVRLLQTIFDTPDTYGSQLDWRGYSVHDAASVMRRFLNHLPQPVITHEYYQAFKDTMKTPFPNLETKIQAYQKLIDGLPAAHQYLLLYLLDMLAFFASVSHKTRMELRCLAAIFTPGMLYHPKDERDPKSYDESKRVLEFLIQHQEKFSMPRSHGASQTSSNVDLVGETAAACATSASEGSVETPLPDQQSSAVSDRKSSHSPTPDPCPSLIYAIVPGSYSGTCIVDLNRDMCGDLPNIEPSSSLRRTKTTPTKRNKFGEHEPPQIVHLNRNPSQTRKDKRWVWQL